MDFAMDGQLVSSEIVLPFPTLRETCVKKIIRDTEKIVEGLEFNQLASPKFSFILGPFSYLGIHILYSCIYIIIMWCYITRTTYDIQAV